MGISFMVIVWAGTSPFR
ncbi:membrane protein YpdK [Salmonella enterica subsp. enterica]|nr:membrane protein YpdK [Salmonella enterica subsp. enterica]